MQVKKEDVKKRIEESATHEFLTKGYLKTSLSTIAKNANLSKGAIYSYFESKNELFRSLVMPAIDYLTESMENCYIHDGIDNEENMVEIYENNIDIFKDFSYNICKNKDSFKMLLFSAEGSDLNDFREKIIDMYHESFKKYLRIKNKDNHKVSEMFVHTLAKTYISYIEEILLHGPNKKSIDAYSEQMAIFISAGFKEFLKL